MAYKFKSERLIYDTDDYDQIFDQMCDAGLTDGLPVVLPTEARVTRFIDYMQCNPKEVVGIMEPSKAPATMEKIAICCVMAGCLPEYMPVVVAAIRAMTAPGFDLFGSQATTHPCAMVQIVNGPIREMLNINCTSGCMGPGWRANATIGRAVRLCMLQIGGSIPGVLDKATQGTPAKYTFCFGENEEQNPWEPLHVERGFKPEDSTVSVCSIEAPHDINAQDAQSAEDVCRIVASSIMSPGSSNFRFVTGSDMLIVFGPEHASFIARDGWTKDDIRNYLFEHARVPRWMIHERHIAKRIATPVQYGATEEAKSGAPIPVVLDKSNFIIAVAGGEGLHSTWMPNWGAPKHHFSTAKIEIPQ